jgi:predicted RNA-binding protein associated with RNAse of E/G family
MKRRRADRAEWRRIVERRFVVAHLEAPAFTGYATLLLLDRFAETFYARVGEATCCVAAAGYPWLQHFPAGAFHTVTTMFDASGAVVQWYIDVCRAHGVDGAGVPWFDDLYLDIVVSPNGAAHLLDADELEDARRQGLVSPGEYALAWAEARRLLALIERDAMPLLAESAAHREFLARQLVTR